jgi:hypothetical protein
LSNKSVPSEIFIKSREKLAQISFFRPRSEDVEEGIRRPNDDTVNAEEAAVKPDSESSFMRSAAVMRPK